MVEIGHRMSGFEKAVEEMKAQISDIRARLSDGRKKGFNVSIAQLKFTNIQSKLSLAEVTKSVDDLKRVNDSLQEVHQEIDEALGNPKRGARELVIKEDDPALVLIDEADDALKRKDASKIKESYLKLRQAYGPANPEMKKEIYKKSVELYSALALSQDSAQKRGQ